MHVSDLPQFTVRWYDEEYNELHGVFDTLDHVQEGWGCLFQWTLPLQGDLKHLDPDRRTGVFEVFADEPDTLTVGMVFPWIPQYYHSSIAWAVADPDHAWEERIFKATDTDAFRQGKSYGWQQVGGTLPEGATPAGTIPGGWDHEHCVICEEQINAERPVCYVDADDLWLCPDCYRHYAAPHNIGFVVGE
jgi:hypothetical protein